MLCSGPLFVISGRSIAGRHWWYLRGPTLLAVIDPRYTDYHNGNDAHRNILNRNCYLAAGVSGNWNLSHSGSCLDDWAAHGNTSFDSNLTNLLLGIHLDNSCIRGEKYHACGYCGGKFCTSK